MADAEINVEIRLRQAQVQADAQKAAETAQKVFSSPGYSKKGLSSFSEADRAEIKKRNLELLGQSSLSGTTIAARQAGKAAGEAFGKGLADGASAGGGVKTAVEKAAAKSAKDAVTFKKDMSFLMMPLFNPGSMWATLFSGRQTYSAMNSESGAKFRGKFMGGMGPGAATGLLVAGATAAGLVLKALTKTVKETIAAYEHARQLYAKSLMSGLGLNFTVKRGMLASIMGVSEEDAIKFGAALNYLNPKIEWAANILAKTATPLTQVSWEFKIVMANAMALFSELATKLAPTILAVTEDFNEMIKSFSDANSLDDLVQILKVAMGVFMGIATVVVDVVLGLATGLTLIFDTVRAILNSVSNVLIGLTTVIVAFIDGIWEAGKKLVTGKGVAEANKAFNESMNAGAAAVDANLLPMADFRNTVAMANTTSKIDAALSKATVDMFSDHKDKKSTMPTPISFMKQLPASAWERAGLIIGGRGNSTNDLIRQGNKHLATIAAAVTGGRVARSFGLDPAISNP